MSKAKVGVSMLYCLGEPFNRMVKRLGNMNTRYIEILDDGTHELDKKRVATLKEAAKSYRFRVLAACALRRHQHCLPIQSHAKRFNETAQTIHGFTPTRWMLKFGFFILERKQA